MTLTISCYWVSAAKRARAEKRFWNWIGFAPKFGFKLEVMKTKPEPAEEEEVESDAEHAVDGRQVLHLLHAHDAKRGSDLQNKQMR